MTKPKITLKSELFGSLIFACIIMGCSRHASITNAIYFKELQTRKISSDATVTWKQFGPGGSGYCDIVEYHPTDPNCVIMSPDLFNNYGSWDNGISWQSISDSDGTSLDIRRMRDIAFSHHDPDYGVSIDERGWLWTTRDRGHSWQRNFGFPAKGVCSAVAIDPSDDQVMYVGSGNFWNVKWNRRTFDSPRRQVPKLKAEDRLFCDFNVPLQSGYLDAPLALNCEFDPESYSRTDYYQLSVTEYGKVWRTNDGGATWKLINQGLPTDLDVGKILFHPLNSKILYLATNYGLYQSKNQGESWVNIGKNLPHNMLRDLAIYLDEETQKPILIAIDQVFWQDNDKGSITSSGGVFKSSDDGENWQSLNNNLHLDLTKTSGYIVNSYYKAISQWYRIPVEETKKRFPKLPTKALQNFNRLLIDPSNPGRIYVGHNAVHDISFDTGDLWKTENGGKEWVISNRIGNEWQTVDQDFWQARGNPTDINMRFAHLQRQEMELPYGGRTGCRALTINSNGDLIAVFEQQTFQSTDHGNTWQQIDAVETGPDSGCWIGTGTSNLSHPRFYMHESLEGQHLLLSGEHGLWQICEGGEGKNQKIPAVRQVAGQTYDSGDPLSISSIAVHPKNPSTWFMQMYRQNYAGQVLKTVDKGKNWESISHPVKFPNVPSINRVRTHGLLIDEDNPNYMYFCVPSLDKSMAKKQYPKFNEFGVYRSKDGGYTWNRVNKGLPAEGNVTDICFDPKNHKNLYAALHRSTDASTKGGLYYSDDHGSSWEALPIPSEIKSLNDVHTNKQGDNIYIAGGLRHGKLGSGGVWVSRDKGKTWGKIFDMPNVLQVETAPYDPERIAVVVGENSEIDNLNPGIYVSFDSGNSWHKSNTGIGQPYWVVDIKFDLADPQVLWCGLFGSGWYKGDISRR